MKGLYRSDTVLSCLLKRLIDWDYNVLINQFGSCRGNRKISIAIGFARETGLFRGIIEVIGIIKSMAWLLPLALGAVRQPNTETTALREEKSFVQIMAIGNMEAIF